MQQQPQYTFPSLSINLDMSTQLNNPNADRVQSQATMPFNGLQLDDQIVRKSNMSGWLIEVSPYSSPPLNGLANDPLLLSSLKHT